MFQLYIYGLNLVFGGYVALLGGGGGGVELLLPGRPLLCLHSLEW